MKTTTGIVISNKMTKTVVVSVDRLKAHPMYHKRMRKTKKFHAHDELGAKIGDTVEMTEIRPMSKTKFWKVSTIIGTTQQAVAPVTAPAATAAPKAVAAKKPAAKPVKKSAKK